MKDLEINTAKIDDCVADSYIEVDGVVTDNKLFKEDIEWSTKLGIVMHPSISINNITYRGDINGYDVFKAICAGFST